MSVPIHEGSSPRDLTIAFLRLAAERHRINAEALRASESHRAYFAAAARRHGVTNQRIADEYGITEGAVRAMLKRAGDAK